MYRPQLDDLLHDFAAQELDWPETDEEIDAVLASQPQVPTGTPFEPVHTDVVLRRLREAGEDPKPAIEAANTQGNLFDNLLSQPISIATTAGAGKAFVTLLDIVRRAYLEVFDGYSIDKLIADPERNAVFVESCWRLGAKASQYDLNRCLINGRKAKLIGKVDGVRAYQVRREDMDRYLFACEFALRLVQNEQDREKQRHVTLDRVLCDPSLGNRFEELARQISPGFTSLDYRWGAFTIRKDRERGRSTLCAGMPQFETVGRRDTAVSSRVCRNPGFLWLKGQSCSVYVGQAANLRVLFERLMDIPIDCWGDTLGLFSHIGSTQLEFFVAPAPGIPSASHRERLRRTIVEAEKPMLNVVSRQNGKIAAA